MKPGTYDGSTNWGDYLIQFTLIADHYGWDDRNKAIQLAVSLRGAAQTVLSDLSPDQRLSFASLTYALSARFEPIHQSELYRARMKARVRHRGEALPELAQDIRKLVRHAYPSASLEIREQLAKDCLIDSFNDHDLEWSVLQGKPKSVEDALKLALEYEAFQKGHRGRHGDLRPFKAQDQGPTLEMHGDYNIQNKSITSAQAPIMQYVPNQPVQMNGNETNARCRFCKRLGHVESECRRKKQLRRDNSCYYCGLGGHFIGKCEKRKQDMANTGTAVGQLLQRGNNRDIFNSQSQHNNLGNGF